MKLCKLFVITLFLGLATSTWTWAATIELEFNSLPSVQGWLYQGTVTESTVFSVDGSKLTQDTFSSPGDNAPVYGMNNVINPLFPFTVDFTVRVLNSDGASPTICFVAFTGTEVFQVGLNTGSVYLNGTYYSFDTTEFHDYRLEAIPGTGFSFFVDDNPFQTGLPAPNPAHNSLLFGDGSAFPGADGIAEMTAYSFNQVPIPGAIWLLGSGLVGLVGLRKKLKK
jgi:hypothetical protein